MSEDQNPATTDDDDTEGHRVRDAAPQADATDDDVEGHRMAQNDDDSDDDVEGHRTRI